MAMEERRDNATTFGSTNQGPSGVRVNASPTTVGYISLVDPQGVERFLWFNSSGWLMTSTTVPTAPDSSGNIVGLQP